MLMTGRKRLSWLPALVMAAQMTGPGAAAQQAATPVVAVIDVTLQSAKALIERPAPFLEGFRGQNRFLAGKLLFRGPQLVLLTRDFLLVDRLLFLDLGTNGTAQVVRSALWRFAA